MRSYLIFAAWSLLAGAGIPLIGASLSLALAGMDTLLKFGIGGDWDREIRGQACQ